MTPLRAFLATMEGHAPIKIGDVPCNGCRLCCQGTKIILRPEEDATKYRTVPYENGSAMRLAQKLNGDCTYLGETGCTIYEDRPSACRGMDCRVTAMLAMDDPRGDSIVLQRIIEKGTLLLKEIK